MVHARPTGTAAATVAALAMSVAVAVATAVAVAVHWSIHSVQSEPERRGREDEIANKASREEVT